MNLVQAAELVKKTINILLAGFALLVFILLVKAPLGSLATAIFPPKDLPTVQFGLLDPLSFTEYSTNRTNAQYVLNTQTGKLPNNLPKNGTVYKYKAQPFSFSAGEKAQQNAAKLGYPADMLATDLRADTFVWQDTLFGGNLRINVNNQTIELQTPLSGLGQYFPAGLLTPTSAVNQAKKILQEMGLFSNTLYASAPPSDIKVAFGKFRGSRVVKADSQLEAQIARVDFFRKVDDLPILGPDPKQGLLHLFVKGVQKDGGYPQLNFPKVLVDQWEIDQKISSTYPLIPISLAWEQVKQDRGVIANITPKDQSFFEPYTPVTVGKVLINNVFLAYFDNTLSQKFMQPIYVFEGNYTGRTSTEAGNITIYYPAISGDYIRIGNSQ